MQIENIIKHSIYILLIYSVVLAKNATAGLPVSAPIQDIKKVYAIANDLFNRNLYSDAIKNYYALVNANNSDDNIVFNSWKRIGIIDIHYHRWEAAFDHLSRAKKIIKKDNEVNNLINYVRKRIVDKYIIQVGVFESSYNASMVIKGISTTIDDFTLIKKKYGNKYIVYFDGFNNKHQADALSERLKALNEGYNFIVKNKNKL